MRASRFYVGFLSAAVLLLCLSGIAAQHGHRGPGKRLAFRSKNAHLEGRGASDGGDYGDPAGYDYGYPAPYGGDESASATASSVGYNISVTVSSMDTATSTATETELATTSTASSTEQTSSTETTETLSDSSTESVATVQSTVFLTVTEIATVEETVSASNSMTSASEGSDSSYTVVSSSTSASEVTDSSSSVPISFQSSVLAVTGSLTSASYETAISGSETAVTLASSSTQMSDSSSTTLASTYTLWANSSAMYPTSESMVSSSESTVVMDSTETGDLSTVYLTRTLTLSPILATSSSATSDVESSSAVAPTVTPFLTTTTSVSTVELNSTSYYPPFPMPSNHTVVSGTAASSIGPLSSVGTGVSTLTTGGAETWAPYANSTSGSQTVKTVFGTVTSIVTPSQLPTTSRNGTANSTVWTSEKQSAGTYLSSFNTAATGSMVNLTSGTAWSMTPPYPTGQNSTRASTGTAISATGAVSQSSSASYLEITTTIYVTSPMSSTQVSHVSYHNHTTGTWTAVPPFPFPSNSSTVLSSAGTVSSFSMAHTSVYPLPANSSTVSSFFSAQSSVDAVTGIPSATTANSVEDVTSLYSTGVPQSSASVSFPPYPTANSSQSVITMTLSSSVFVTVSGASGTVSSDSSYITTPVWTNTTAAPSSMSPTYVPSSMTAVSASNSTETSPWITRITLTTVKTIFPQPSTPPFPTGNSSAVSKTAQYPTGTGSQWSGVTATQVWTTTIDAASSGPYYNTSISTSSCTDSMPPYPYANYTGAATTCTTVTSGTGVMTMCMPLQTGPGSPWSSGSPPKYTGNYTASCNTTGTGSAYPATSSWKNTTSIGSATESTLYPLPTTLETSFVTSFITVDATTAQKETIYPQPTGGQPSSKPELPDNPNYPWGGDSPLHRHQNVTQLGDGVLAAISRRDELEASWNKFLDKLKGMLKPQKEEVLEQRERK